MDPGPHRRPVFFEHATAVGLDALEACKLLSDDDFWGEIGTPAYRYGNDRVVQVGAEPTAHDVHVKTGSAKSGGQEVVFPVRWEAMEMSSLLPVLDANLVVAPHGTGRCQLALRGSYRAPLGQAGRVDAADLHRAAESAVQSFLRRVVEHLEDRCRSASS